jgi:hypothetical protein
MVPPGRSRRTTKQTVCDEREDMTIFNLSEDCVMGALLTRKIQGGGGRKQPVRNCGFDPLALRPAKSYEAMQV